MRANARPYWRSSDNPDKEEIVMMKAAFREEVGTWHKKSTFIYMEELTFSLSYILAWFHAGSLSAPYFFSSQSLCTGG